MRSNFFSSDHDQDVEIIESSESAEINLKMEPETESEKGSAIIVLDSVGSRGNRIQTNGGAKIPNIHVEHRAPLGRPKVHDAISKDTQRAIIGLVHFHF